MKKLIALVFTLLPAIVLYSQFNDSTFYMTRYSTTGIINRTNETSSYALTNALRFSMNKKKIGLNSNTSWVYGRQQSRLTNNDFFTALDFNWYKNFEHFYYWGLATYESSYSLRVNNRAQQGLGGAYDLVDRPDFVVNVSDGILYEFGDLKVNDTTRDVYNTFRNSFRFRFKLAVNERLSLDGISFIQNSLQEKNDYIFNSTTNLSFKLMKWISLATSLKYNKVNRTNRENLLLTFGITAEKYF